MMVLWWTETCSCVAVKVYSCVGRFVFISIEVAVYVSCNLSLESSVDSAESCP
jgi:hypothetical protein